MQIQLLRNRGGKLGVPLIANLGVFNKRVCVTTTNGPAST